MKKKSLLVIAIALVLIMASIATMFMLRNTDNGEDSFNSLSNNSTNADWMPAEMPDEINDNIAEDLGLTRDELDELLNKPLDLTDEEQAKLQDILDSMKVPEIEEFIEDDDPNDNIHTFIDKNGNQGTMEVDIPELTEEDVDQFYSDFETFLDQLANSDIPLEDIELPQLGGNIDESTDNTEDTDAAPIYDSDGNIHNSEEGYNGEYEGTEEVEVSTYMDTGLTLTEIAQLPDEEKIALGFNQRSDGSWADKYGIRLPSPEPSESEKEAANKSSEGVKWQG